MDRHAAAFLKAAESWGWPQTLRVQETSPSSNLRPITLKLLSGFIVESQALGGELVDQFWSILGECHPTLQDNIEKLQQTATATLPGEQTLAVLFDDVDPLSINFDRVFKLAEDLFTNLGIAFMNPGRHKSGSSTEHSCSVGDDVAKAADELVVLAREEGFGKRKQRALKALAFRRDGETCLLTNRPFSCHPEQGVTANLAHVIPNSVHGKPDTIKCIATFAGAGTAEAVVEQLNTLGNVMILQDTAHKHYDNLGWGIEALNVNGKTKYFYQRHSDTTGVGPWPIYLTANEEIKFGSGTGSTQLGSGPHPALCNLQLAVARVLKMSGAADVITQWMEDADDGDFPVYIDSGELCDVLAAKLLLSGRALIA